MVDPLMMKYIISNFLWKQQRRCSGGPNRSMPRELFDASRSYSLQSLLEWDASANGCIYRPVWWWHVVVELS
ncbi:hypothetical protein HanIR_Chr05g0209291 [Helianthus annuus]|nr:hypothetical protein HanIR_Chr05g0209291 [Helianthus annuus]